MRVKILLQALFSSVKILLQALKILISGCHLADEDPAICVKSKSLRDDINSMSFNHSAICADSW